MKWSSCNVENESPQVLLGFEAHFCLQQLLISRDWALCKHSVGHSARLQHAAKDSVSFLPLPFPVLCSAVVSSAYPCSPLCSPLNLYREPLLDPCRQRLRSHPSASHTVCCSVCCPPPEQGDLPSNTSRAVWFVNLGTFFLFFQCRIVPLNSSSFTLKRQQCWNATRHSPIPW